jgi:hypothetical protein
MHFNFDVRRELSLREIGPTIIYVRANNEALAPFVSGHLVLMCDRRDLK